MPPVETPFGVRRLTYADYTASGRALEFIEDFIHDEVLPTYGNTHTEASATGRRTTHLREEAREIIQASVGATAAEHAVIFAGSGATGAIDRLVGILGLRAPQGTVDRDGLAWSVDPHRRAVVLVEPYEHHSNELSWRETITEVVAIPEDADGQVDLGALEQRLRQFADRPLRIGSFSAASNVTGIVSNTSAIARLLHAHGALSFWDFAAAGPYVPIQMAEIAAASHRLLGSLASSVRAGFRLRLRGGPANHLGHHDRDDRT